MADPLNINGRIPPSPLRPTKRLREDTGIENELEHHVAGDRLRASSAAGNVESNEEAPWYSAISSRSYHVPVPQEPQLPTPQSYGSSNLFPFFPVAVGSPESPLAHAHSRTLGGVNGGSMTSRIQARYVIAATDYHSQSQSGQRCQALTIKATLTYWLTTKLSIKTESPPPVLAPPHDISPSKSISPRPPSPEAQTAALSLSSPFVEKARPNMAPPSVRRLDHAALRPSSPTSLRSQALLLSSPAHIEEREPSSAEPTNCSLPPIEEVVRQPGGELDRIRNHILSVEDARRVELEGRRPEYLKRLQRDDIGLVVPKAEHEPVEKDSVGIAITPARGRRIQLFDFQETSAESFEESLMTHGYGTYGEPRTPHRPLMSTEGLSKEAMDWLAYNTPVALPGVPPPHSGSEVELNEKELKKRKRLEAFKGSAARAYAKLYPAEVEGLGRVLLNVPPEEADELAGPPAKKRATGKRKRGGVAVDKKGKLPDGAAPVQTQTTEPRWLDREIPWCLREKEREEEQKARDADRLAWIDKYFAHDTDSDDEKESDKNEERAPSPTWGQVSEDLPDAPKRGRGKAVPLQANPNRTHPAIRDDANRDSGSVKHKSLFFPTDPADARMALMSKRSVRLLAQRKLRQNGQRSASLRGIGEGRLACACGRDDDDDGRPAVQCDECFNWHHLECIGVRDEAELGEEDDPWFCPACAEQSEAALSAADWRNQRQPTFVPTDEVPVHSSTRSDVAFYSSSPLREWGSSGSLHTPVQGHGRLHGVESFRRSVWDDPHTGPGPSTPVMMLRGVQVRTPGASQGERGQHINGMFDSFVSPRGGYPRFTDSFTTPKNTGLGHISRGSSSFGLSAWPTHTSGLFATPTPRGRLGSSGSGYGGFTYSSDDPMNASFGQQTRVTDGMYAPDDTPIRRAPIKETRTLGLTAHLSSGSLMDSPLAGRGGQEVLSVPEGNPEIRRPSAK
ncbi:uncharacterized protein FOMMEDRAFT_28164 [Fomitiporia mediterranea MF3/22]|uniref:uncharacterized protein n=1 Tax=Fomitiporia mediterranea (strain MF3/22) TaxID=694068 RepID=UPI0004409BA5|nr:uncharacterized protein FOMMEDRAFT_28164 [Fomitiporia mediterranea MF3/22]EJD04474.1 hypothetical protein FOMMEDRAFT_28164 [Fomitiporia mediterranea MF3/22]